MTRKILTDVERRFVKAFYSIYDDIRSRKIDYPLKIMKKTAYHEAAHFIARNFTRVELDEVLSLSIIPDEINLGRMHSETLYYEPYLEKVGGPEFQRGIGYSLLLEHFAGFGAQMIYEKSEHKDLIEYLQEEQDEQWEDYFNDESLDMHRAKRIAGILSKPHLPQYRIMSRAAKWTMEMLKIPEIWNAVEKVANILLAKGEITDENNEISDLIVSLNVPHIKNLPKWNRRIYKGIFKIKG